MLLLLRLRSPMLKGDVDFFGAVEYLVHRETKLRHSCGLWTNRCRNAVQTLRLRTYKDLWGRTTRGSSRRSDLIVTDLSLIRVNIRGVIPFAVPQGNIGLAFGLLEIQRLV